MARQRMQVGIEQVSPAMAAQWASLMDAVDAVEATHDDPAACIEEIEACRASLLSRGLALCAAPATSPEDVRRKLGAAAVIGHHEGDQVTLAVPMIELAVRIDLDRLGLSLGDLLADLQAH